MLSTLKNTSSESLASLAEEMRVRQTTSVILLFSMGSQFDHLIAQALARLGVYCQVCDPASITADDVETINPSGIVVSGGPASMHAEPPPFDTDIFELGIPVFGICLGFQMWASHVGLSVVGSEKREFHPTPFSLRGNDPLFADVDQQSVVLQSHGDMIQTSDMTNLTFVRLGSTEHAPISAGRYGNLWGVQFHPEVSDSEAGDQMFANFCFKICGIKDAFPARDAAQDKIAKLKQEIGDGKVLVALSGGSDSSIVAHLLRYATDSNRKRLRGVYIKGIDRPDDEADALRFFGNQPWIEMIVVDATKEFLEAYRGITTAKEKRVAMRGIYKAILETQIEAFGADFIAQGTLYTDLRESGLGHETGARIATIKQHHNTGLKFSVPELMPLADCVKDNARDIGRLISVPSELLIRHPFPGPGLTLRCEGEVTAEKLHITREADRILMEEIHTAGLYEKIWQAGARVTSSLHTTTKGDDAGSGYVIMCFAISSVNGFTARPYPLPHEVMERIADRMGSEIREAGAVAFRFSGKPFSTIEAE